MKIDENICLISHCEETKLLVDRMTLFCVEHSKRFFAFWSRYEVDSELDNMLEIDEEFQKEFFTDMVYDFCYEDIEEWKKINTPPIKNKQKRKKKTKNESR
ncbi:hypothetical protein GL982_10865 (plasmid) [Spiroplasma citri]|uniref:hypothetical protein n=1 Tax=Spiroplasma citri TaxID=2133 RepID=UPI0013A093B3|nr:hypothetical protein [Spiroplasma citri]QIA74045.1 hypothetical protein GL982_10865 [Spiroplasma citri]